jgi:hypothetical protein
MAFPASVMGPLDLAPLMRAISALFDMVVSYFEVGTRIPKLRRFVRRRC